MVRIFIDIDNIVADFHTRFREYLNTDTGKSLKLDDIVEFDFYKDFHISQDRERACHKKFIENKGYENLKIIAGCKEGIECLCRYGDIKFITARPAHVREATARWLKKQGIPLKSDSLIFAIDKLSFAPKYDIIIEDKWEDAILAAEQGKDVILFDYPWNNIKDDAGNIKEHENIRRASDWKEALLSIWDIVEKKHKKNLDDQAYNIWKDAIDVQMHFNELIMKNRTTASSMIVVAIGAAFGIYKLGLTSPAIKPFMLGDFVAGLAFFGLLAYGLIDTRYYFKLLLGSVWFTEKMEWEFRKLGLTSAITRSVGHCSAKKILSWHYCLLAAPVLAYGILRLFGLL